MRRRTLIAAAAGMTLGLLFVLLMPARVLFTVPLALQEQQPEPGVRYACAMMCYIADTPGQGLCPVCGMPLKKVVAGALNAEQRARMGVETVAVASDHARVLVRAYGTALYDPRLQRAVIARLPGRVVKRHPATLHEGVDVAVGDPLIDLYSPEAYAAQGELAAAMASGQRELVAALQARFARWNLAHVADAVLAGSEPRDVVTVLSPFAGRVLLAPGGMDAPALPSVGAQIDADQPLMTLVDPERLWLVLHVPELQGRFLRQGQPLRLAADDAGELDGVDARIDWLSPEIDPEIRARAVHVHLRDPRGRVRHGALISARIEAVLGPDLIAADPDDRASWGRFVLVPKEAVLSTGVRHVVWRVRQSHGHDHGKNHGKNHGDELEFEAVAVALGPRLEDERGHDRYVVRAGLAAGDEIAVRGAFMIDSQAQLAGSPSLLFPDGAAQPAAGHRH